MSQIVESKRLARTAEAELEFVLRSRHGAAPSQVKWPHGKAPVTSRGCRQHWGILQLGSTNQYLSTPFVPG